MSRPGACASSIGFSASGGSDTFGVTVIFSPFSLGNGLPAKNDLNLPSAV